MMTELFLRRYIPDKSHDAKKLTVTEHRQQVIYNKMRGTGFGIYTLMELHNYHLAATSANKHT
jgi:hypothetical protein